MFNEARTHVVWYREKDNVAEFPKITIKYFNPLLSWLFVCKSSYDRRCIFFVFLVGQNTVPESTEVVAFFQLVSLCYVGTYFHLRNSVNLRWRYLANF